MMVILRREWLWLVFCLVMVMFVVYMNGRRMKTPAQEIVLQETEGETATETAAEQADFPLLAGLPEADYFVEYRLQRERVRDQQTEILREIVHNPNTDADSCREAQEVFLEISENLAREVKIEGLLTAKGFQDVVVFINPDQVYVVVKAVELELDQVAQIGDIVAGLCAVSLEDIVIDCHP